MQCVAGCYDLVKGVHECFVEHINRGRVIDQFSSQAIGKALGKGVAFDYGFV